MERLGDEYLLFDAEDTPLQVSTPPVLATGFKGSLGLIADYLAWEAGRPVFSEASDESTVAENLFYCGPLLRHRGSMFCFIYKFRARFGIVARTIAERMGVEWRKPARIVSVPSQRWGKTRRRCGISKGVRFR